MMALLRYQDGYQGLIALGFKSVMDEPPQMRQYYHFIDATGKQVSGYYVGQLPNGQLAVGDINNGGRLYGIRAVLWQPMQAEEITA